MIIRPRFAAVTGLVLVGLCACHSDTGETYSATPEAAAMDAPIPAAPASGPAYSAQQPQAGTQAAEAIGVADPADEAKQNAREPTAR